MTTNAETTITTDKTSEGLLYTVTGEWEHSQYDDSDFYRVVYDPAKGGLARYMTFTTRYPSEPRTCLRPIVGSGYEDDARKALESLIYNRIKHEETQVVMEPKIEALVAGVRVRFLEAHSCQRKEVVETVETCEACRYGIPGKWINPRNADDVRECFKCNGTGKATVKRRTKVTETTTIAKGKNKGQEKKVRVMEDIEAGATGVVLSQATFGTFYRNGYNVPDRSNTTVYLRLDDGREVQAPAKKLRMDKEVPSDHVMKAHANDLAFGDINFGSMCNLFYEFFRTSHVRL